MTEASGTGFAIPIGAATSIAAQITDVHASSTVHVGPTAFLGVQIGQASFGGFGLGLLPAARPRARPGSRHPHPSRK